MRAAIFAIGFLVGGLVIGSLLVDEGEVVTLTTRDGAGESFETQLWIVRVEGAPYLRAASPRSDWVARLGRGSEVELLRHDEVQRWRAVPQDDPELRRRVNQAMAEKYRVSDRLLRLLFDPEGMVPIRLEAPRDEPDAAPHGA